MVAATGNLSGSADNALIIDAGGVLVKPLANFQFDQAIALGIVGDAYLDGCNELAKTYPELSASLFAVCAKRN